MWKNAFTRCGIILSLLCSNETGISIRELASQLALPVGQLEEDFARILRSQLLRNQIMLAVEEGDTFIEFLQDQHPEGALTYEEDLKSGVYDDTLLSIDPDSVGLKNQIFFFPVLSSERRILEQKYPALLNAGSSPDVYVKKLTSDLDTDLSRKLDIVVNALTNGAELEMFHKPTQKTLHMTPVGIFHDTEYNALYVIDAAGNSVDLGRVRSNIQLHFTDKAEPKDAFSIGSYLWGVGYVKDPTPTKVVVRINNNTTNLLAKIRADVAFRKHAKLTDCGDGTWLYEDEIIGIDAFRRWLRGYGSSLVVLEPRPLAEEMYRSALNMLKVYESGEFL